MSNGNCTSTRDHKEFPLSHRQRCAPTLQLQGHAEGIFHASSLTDFIGINVRRPKQDYRSWKKHHHHLKPPTPLPMAAPLTKGWIERVVHVGGTWRAEGWVTTYPGSPILILKVKVVYITTCCCQCSYVCWIVKVLSQSFVHCPPFMISSALPHFDIHAPPPTFTLQRTIL